MTRKLGAAKESPLLDGRGRGRGRWGGRGRARGRGAAQRPSTSQALTRVKAREGKEADDDGEEKAGTASLSATAPLPTGVDGVDGAAAGGAGGRGDDAAASHSDGGGKAAEDAASSDSDGGPPELTEVLRRAVLAVEGRWCAQARRRRLCGGACVVAALVCGNHVAVANAGDCRAVLRDAVGRVTQLSTDHRSTDASERRRMLAAGGFVRQGRAMGILEPSRAIGDIDLKVRCLNWGCSCVVTTCFVVTRPRQLTRLLRWTDAAHRRVVIADPALREEEVDPKEGPHPVLLILGTDGVFDVMPNEVSARNCQAVRVEWCTN